MPDRLDFEWDKNKNMENIKKHGVSFEEARDVFYDENRVIHIDAEHSFTENRFICFGKCKNDILTVRFTMRGDNIRIIGAGFWRKGRKIYEEESNLH